MNPFWMDKEETKRRAELEAFVTVYENEMYFAAFDILQNEVEAEQAMFLAVRHILNHPYYIKEENPKQIKNVLILCARHRAINLYRKRKKHPTVSYEQIEPIFGETDAAENIERKITLADALGSLSEEDREVLLLRYSHGYEYKEIAKLLQIKETTVRKRVSRAKLRFERICITMGLIDSGEEVKKNE